MLRDAVSMRLEESSREDPKPSAEPAAGVGGEPPAAKGLSHFLAKVLDQLSLSSWLPATMLVGSLTLLLQMHALGRYDPAAAVQALISLQWGILVVLLFALVLATVIVQAFQYESIRVLEGYFDSAPRPLRQIISWRIRRKVSKRSALESSFNALQAAAFTRARPRILKDPEAGHLTVAHLDAIESDLLGTLPPGHVTTQIRLDAAGMEWQPWALAEDMFYLDGLQARIARFPAPARVMPTRFGNALRAAEDQLDLADDENLEGYAMRYRDRVPNTISTEEREYRTRLDMYGTLVFAFAVLAGAAAGLLWHTGPWQAAVTAVSFLILAAVSYEAAITSAAGYGDALAEIDNFVRAPEELTEEPG